MSIKPFNMKLSKIALIIGMLIIFAGLISIAHQMQRPNNGDGWRVLRSAQILGPQDYYKKQPFPRFFEFKELENIKPIDLIPMSSSAAIVELISFAERAAGFGKFDFLVVTAVYYALYLFGIFLILLNIRFAFVIPALILLLNPYILAYFNSPYEESLFIALCPLLSFFFISGGLAIRSVALAMAATKVQFAPAFLFGIKDLKLKNNLVYLLISMLVIGAVVMKASKFNVPNSYNRYFNGLSYSMAGVSAWPAYDFIARRAIAGEMTSSKDIIFPAGAARIEPYWGSSFWPTGDKLDADESKFISENAGRWFWKTVLANPRHYYRILTEPILTMINADYRMAYVFRSGMNNRWLDIQGLVMQNFGVIFLLASAGGLVMAIRNRNPMHVLFVLFSLMYPLLVVYGDGYYEFEKHVFPVLVLGVVFSIALSFRSVVARKVQAVGYPKAFTASR